MNRRHTAVALILLYGVLLFAIGTAGHLHGQTLAPVAAPTASAGVDWWVVVPILAVVAVLGGWFLWHKKNATAANAAAATAGTDLKALGASILAELSKARAALEAHLAATAPPATAPPAAVAPPAAPTPTPEQLAAVASAQAALDAAKKAAGVA